MRFVILHTYCPEMKKRNAMPGICKEIICESRNSSLMLQKVDQFLIQLLNSIPNMNQEEVLENTHIGISTDVYPYQRIEPLQNSEYSYVGYRHEIVLPMQVPVLIESYEILSFDESRTTDNIQVIMDGN